MYHTGKGLNEDLTELADCLLGGFGLWNLRV